MKSFTHLCETKNTQVRYKTPSLNNCVPFKSTATHMLYMQTFTVKFLALIGKQCYLKNCLRHTETAILQEKAVLICFFLLKLKL